MIPREGLQWKSFCLASGASAYGQKIATESPALLGAPYRCCDLMSAGNEMPVCHALTFFSFMPYKIGNIVPICPKSLIGTFFDDMRA